MDHTCLTHYEYNSEPVIPIIFFDNTIDCIVSSMPPVEAINNR